MTAAISTTPTAPSPALVANHPAHAHHRHRRLSHQRLRVSSTAGAASLAAPAQSTPVMIGRQRYEVREKLADTLFGGVYLCEDARYHHHGDGDAGTGVVAIKQVVLERAKYALQTLAATVDNPWIERRTLTQLARLESHTNILRVRDEFVEGGAWFVVMDHCNGGDLLSALQRAPQHRFPESQAMALFAEVANAVRFLHANDIAHRDLSLENVLLHDGTPKLCDFGLSTDAKQMSCDRVGKAYYMAPEVVAERTYDPAAADMWSLGVMLFIMLTGSPLVPRACESDPAFAAVKKFGVRTVLQVWEMEFSADVTDLLNTLLEVNPAKRCTIEDVVAHAAFPSIDGL